MQTLGATFLFPGRFPGSFRALGAQAVEGLRGALKLRKRTCGLKNASLRAEGGDPSSLGSVCECVMCVCVFVCVCICVECK
jgi:hypothetical protein